jgi:hypothetical protein
MLEFYLSDLARVMSKQSMRQETAEKLRSKQDSDIKNFVDFAVQDSTSISFFYIDHQYVNNIFVEFCGHIFSTNHWHPHRNKLCPL